MKRLLSYISLLLTLALFAGCSSTSITAPELLEPVGVKVVSAQVERKTVYTMQTYWAEVVPQIVELRFESDGRFEEFYMRLGDYVEAGQVLATLQVEAYEEQIDILEQEINDTSLLGTFSDRELSANIAIEKVRLEKLRSEGASDYDCGLKELQIQQLQLHLQQTKQLRNIELNRKKDAINALREKVDASRIIAPFSGRVVYMRELSSGSSVNISTIVVCLADESKLSLHTDYIAQSDLDDADIVYAKVLDKQYDIECLPFDTEEYLAMVLTGKEMNSRFSVDAPDGELHSGQSAVIVALHDYRENVLSIPIDTLYRDRLGRHVYKLVDGNWVRCPVTVGVITETSVEILEGLEEGDVVRGK